MEACEECEYGRHARLTDTFERRHAKGWITDDVTANHIATILAIEVQAKKHRVLLGSDAEIKRPPSYATPSCPRTPVGKRPACQQICCGHQKVVTARSTASLGFKKGWGDGPRGWGSAKARTFLRPCTWRPGTAQVLSLAKGLAFSLMEFGGMRILCR